jgi:hypothetical protein
MKLTFRFAPCCLLAIFLVLPLGLPAPPARPPGEARQGQLTEWRVENAVVIVTR